MTEADIQSDAFFKRARELAGENSDLGENMARLFILAAAFGLRDILGRQIKDAQGPGHAFAVKNRNNEPMMFQFIAHELKESIDQLCLAAMLDQVIEARKEPK